jgi:endonuclease/exonuclease/phosphatase family metal-dependent hydrolase
MSASPERVPRSRRRIGVAVLVLTAASCAARPPMAIERPHIRCREVVPPDAAAIRWIGPSDRRDVRQLDRWCSAVGPVEVAAPAAAADRAIDVLTLVSWNVHVGGGDVAALVDRLRRGDYTAGVPVRDYALLLQEALRADDQVPARVDADAAAARRILAPPTHAPLASIGEVARSLGLGYVYAPSMRNGRGGAPEDRGNAILSTLPLTGLVAIELPFERQRRVAIAATIHGRRSDGIAWTLALADAHLDTAMAWTRGGPLAARRRQADALVDALAVVDGTPAILAGDFNAWLGEDEPAVRHLRKAFPDAPRLPAEATWSAGAIGATLDFVLARNGGVAVKVRRLPDRLGSDHYPLLAEMRFK